MGLIETKIQLTLKLQCERKNLLANGFSIRKIITRACAITALLMCQRLHVKETFFIAEASEYEFAIQLAERVAKANASRSVGKR